MMFACSVPPCVASFRPVHLCTLAIAVLLVAGWGLAPASAQPAPDRPRIVDYRPIAAKALPRPGDICTLHPGSMHAKTQILPALPSRGKAAKTANIVVDYNGFTPEARAAFERAVDIWETHIRSDVVIKVRANYGPQAGDNVLASAGPVNLWFGTTQDGQESIYPDALIDALLGENAVIDDGDPNNDDEPDIRANFSNQINWYFGPAPPDGPGPSSGQADFTTVVLHELAHGLGFFGSMTVDGGQGNWGFGTSDPAVPAIYDRFAENENGTELINTGLYPNPSTPLANVLTSNEVFFSGPESDVGAAVGTGPIPPKLYLPSTWERGSSYSHVDEATYPSGDPNALMTPRIGREVIHQPGSITCGMFADMGWRLGPSCAAYFGVEVAGFEVQNTGNRQFELSWAETRTANVEQYEIQSSYFDSPFAPDTVISSEGAQQYTVSLRETTIGKRHDVGEFGFRLVFIRPNGERVPVGEGEVTVRLRDSFELAEIYPNPFSTQANIKLTVREAQTFRVEVYNALGQRVAVLYDRQRPANDPRPITFDASKLGTLSSGRYFFRVIGEEFEQTRSAVFVR